MPAATKLNLKIIGREVMKTVVPALRARGFAATKPTDVMRSNERCSVYLWLGGTWQGNTGALMVRAGAIPPLGALSVPKALPLLAHYTPAFCRLENFLLDGLLQPLTRVFPSEGFYAYEGKSIERVVADVGKLFDGAIDWAEGFDLRAMRDSLHRFLENDWADKSGTTDHNLMFTSLVGRGVAELALGDAEAARATQALLLERAQDKRVGPTIAELARTRWGKQLVPLLPEEGPKPASPKKRRS